MPEIKKVNDTKLTTNILLTEILEQLKLLNATLEEVHAEVHEISNRGGSF
jgi:hypothetical protein